MSLEPILQAPLAIQIHVATVLPAFVIGTWQIFLSRKGSKPHRVAGFAYLALMVATAIDSLFIHALMPKAPLGLSPIHLLVPLTLFAVYAAVTTVRRHDISGHRRAMQGLYIGAVLLAGALTLLPGRIMHAIVFGG